MAAVCKSFVSAFILTLVVSCLITVNPSFASVPKPSVPEFTVQYANGTVQVVIENQPYIYSSGGVTYHLYYNVRVDPHFGLGWMERYPLTSGYTGPSSPKFEYVTDPEHSIQSNSTNTTIIFPIGPTSDIWSEGENNFQVEALVGHDSHIWTATHVFYPEYGGYDEYAVACDATSGWSDTVTLNLAGIVPTYQPSNQETTRPSYSNTIFSFPENFDYMELGLLIALCVIAVLLAVIALMYRKQTKNPRN